MDKVLGACPPTHPICASINIYHIQHRVLIIFHFLAKKCKEEGRSQTWVKPKPRDFQSKMKEINETWWKCPRSVQNKTIKGAHHKTFHLAKNLHSLFTTPLHLDSRVSRQNNIKNPSQNFIHSEKTYTICLQHHWI